MKNIKIQILLIFALLGFMPLFAQTPIVKSSLDTNAILIGDQTVLHFQITQQKDQIVSWPNWNDTITKQVEILGILKLDSTTLPNNQLLIDLRLLITSWDTGYIVIPPQSFRYDVLNDSSFRSFQSEPLLMQVKNVAVDLKKEIKDIKPILEEPWTWKELIPYLIAVLIVLILAAIAFYIWKRIKNKQPILSLPKKPAIPAHLIAIEKLNQLNQQKLWQQGHHKAYYSELTDIMRTYMEAQLRFSAMEMISEDIISQLKKMKIEDTLLKESEKILKLADFVKFAKTQPLGDESSAALKWAYNFVEITRPKADVDVEKKEVNR